jgi:hypothetical protein
MQTYQERVYRYQILRHEDLPEAHKQAYRDRGIDPDDNWTLIWSFETYEAAHKCLLNCRLDAAWFQTYKIVDNGEASFIERGMF